MNRLALLHGYPPRLPTRSARAVAARNVLSRLFRVRCERLCLACGARAAAAGAADTTGARGVAATPPLRRRLRVRPTRATIRGTKRCLSLKIPRLARENPRPIKSRKRNAAAPAPVLARSIHFPAVEEEEVVEVELEVEALEVAPPRVAIKKHRYPTWC